MSAPSVEVFAFGGGVPSVGAMVLAAQVRIRFLTFRPFRRAEAWRSMRRDRARLVHRAARLERTPTERRLEQGKDEVFLTDVLRPLDQAFPDGVLTLPVTVEHVEGSCDGGWCWT